MRLPSIALLLAKIAGGTLAIMYFLAAIGLAVMSLAAADCYWHHWWMFPVQLFAGIFLTIVGAVAWEKYFEDRL